MLISVLEDLAEPQFVIQLCGAWSEARGCCWSLQVGTFREAIPRLVRIPARIQSQVEIDDHKMFYDKRDWWPMLVRTGFEPSQIRLRYHKFGLICLQLPGRTASSSVTSETAQILD